MRPRPERLIPFFREMPWGSHALSPWFPDSDKTIGEVWHTWGNLLVKFLFTKAALSVQVHPDDDYARRVENSPGKTEMWSVLRAEPGASIAVGFREQVDREQVRRAAESGEIIHMLEWIPVGPGDSIFTPAGTVHALGPGLTLIEIQQNSDITYRMYDYSRGRQLHLDKALEVAHLGPHPGKSKPPALPSGGWLLAECPYFHVEQHEHVRPGRVRVPENREELWVAAEGCAKLAGDGGELLLPAGTVCRLPAGTGAVRIAPLGRIRLLRAWEPSQ